VLPLVAYGSWRALRRAKKDWTAGRICLSWMLPLFGVVMVAGCLSLGSVPAHSLIFAGLAVMLSLFCLADVTRGIGERLVLAPPETSEHAERMAAPKT
jgi:hypothetical protein